MAKKRPHVPACVHHKPTGQARVRIEGRDFYLGKFGTPEADEAYRRIIAEWFASGTLPEARTAGKTAESLSINELILAYFRFAQTYYVKNGEQTGEVSLIRDTMRVLRVHYGTSTADSFGPLKLKAVRESMIAKGWCRTEINRKIGLIRRMFKWGVENEIVRADTLHALQAVAGLRRGRSEARESEPVRPVAEADINAVLPFVAAQVRDMVRLQLLAGCRPGEICSLRPCDVCRDGDVWEYRPESHKTEHHGRERIIFFGPRAQEILCPWLDNRPAEAFCFSPAEAQAARNAEKRRRRKSPVQPSQRDRTKPDAARTPGDCYTTASYRRAIQYGCTKAGIGDAWSPNQLRHSRATWLRRQYGIEAAQVILGHSTADVTQIYAERDFESARRVMAEVG
ncbi:tyrosine-type recombinase/integrase [bacterium]|nr:tyrosine-type recombinase/integrase [bacterium]